MTRKQAETLAKRDRHYYARKLKCSVEWCVWDSVSDHEVEFDRRDIEAAKG
jgi:hypothetical protein